MVNGISYIGSPSFVSPDVELRGRVSIGHGSCVGYPVDGDGLGPTIIYDEVVIGAMCVIERGTVLMNCVNLDHYCRVGSGTTISAHTKLLYGAKVYDNCSIGARCIVGGNVDDRVIIEDDVTYMGAMAHSYRDAGTIDTWDDLEQPSPVIRRGAVIGQNALIIGAVEIGQGSYIAAGEIVRHDIPAECVFYKGKLSSIAAWHGVLKARSLDR